MKKRVDSTGTRQITATIKFKNPRFSVVRNTKVRKNNFKFKQLVLFFFNLSAQLKIPLLAWARLTQSNTSQRKRSASICAFPAKKCSSTMLFQWVVRWQWSCSSKGKESCFPVCFYCRRLKGTPLAIVITLIHTLVPEDVNLGGSGQG